MAVTIFQTFPASVSEKAMAPHSSTLAWKIPWMEEPGRLQSMGLGRIAHDWATSLSLFTFMHWRKKWQPTPVFLPGKSHGPRSLEGCSPWGWEESDMTERLHFHFSLSCIGEGNGNPLQCSCLENPRDRGTWWAAVYGVAQSQTQLKWLSSSSGSRGTKFAKCLFSLWIISSFKQLRSKRLRKKLWPSPYNCLKFDRGPLLR